ncbi:Ldh family oxidoreductase [bacterium]|nr:Ldh family oxidoreductase [bacterium]
MEYKIIAEKKLNHFIESTFLALGFSQEESSNAARVLVLSDLRGIESHGCARLHGYIRLVDAGKIKPKANPFVEREKFSTATLNADGGLGLHMGTKAMELAIEKAEKYGSGWVAVKNSSHFGVAVGHIMKALEKGMIAFSLTNASPLVAPAGGKERLLGTNPICYGFPAHNKSPFILDMATTVVANGKLEVAARKGVEIPLGYAQNKEGEPTTNPKILAEGGSMVPLGSDLEHSSYKGYGLGSVVDILTGVLSGANFGPWVPPFVPFLNQIEENVGEGIGHFVGVWQVEGFMDLPQFTARMDKWIERFAGSKPANGVDKVFIPGEKEYLLSLERQKNGIPIYHKVWENLVEIDQRFSLNILI